MQYNAISAKYKYMAFRLLRNGGNAWKANPLSPFRHVRTATVIGWATPHCYTSALSLFFSIKGQKTSAQACCFLTPISLWCGTVRSVNPQIIYKSLSGLVNYLWTIVFGWLHLVVFFPGRLRNTEIFSKFGKKINCRNFSFQNKNCNPGLPFCVALAQWGWMQSRKYK